MAIEEETIKAMLPALEHTLDTVDRTSTLGGALDPQTPQRNIGKPVITIDGDERRRSVGVDRLPGHSPPGAPCGRRDRAAMRDTRGARARLRFRLWTPPDDDQIRDAPAASTTTSVRYGRGIH